MTREGWIWVAIGMAFALGAAFGSFTRGREDAARHDARDFASATHDCIAMGDGWQLSFLSGQDCVCSFIDIDESVTDTWVVCPTTQR